jgi:glucan biosynthesis protein C
MRYVPLTPQIRFYSLDCVRAVLLNLGILLHAAWLYRDQSKWMLHLHDFIHSFRMEAFFILAGFFSGMMIEKYGTKEFLIRRARRLGIPLLFCGFIFDSLMNCGSLRSWRDFSLELAPSYWMKGAWLQHLWFLATLLQFVLILFAIVHIGPKFSSKVKSLNTNIFVTCLLIGSASFILRSINAGAQVVLKEGAFIGIYPYALTYAAFFAAGYYFFHHKALLKALREKLFLNLLSVCSFWSLHPILSHVGGGSVVFDLWQGFYSLNICGIMLWVADRYCSKEVPLVRWFSDAAYTVYLVHWPCMIVCFRWVRDSNFPVWLEFCILVTVTAIGSFSCYFLLVRRFDLFSWLFNGKSMSKDPLEGISWSVGKPVRT